MNSKIGRRDLLYSSVALAAAAVLPNADAWNTRHPAITGPDDSQIRLGVASYSFRKFGRADVIRCMKELNTPYLNVKEMHLPMTSAADVQQASEEYRAAGITLTAAGAIYFTKDEDDDMRHTFDYCKTAGIPLIVAGPTPKTLPRLEKFARKYDV